MGRYKCKVTIIITHVRGLITPPITTHEPPSSSRSNTSCRRLRRRRGNSCSRSSAG